MLNPQPALRVLLVASHLKRRSGMVLHVRDLALALLRSGHTPIVYSLYRGKIADELRHASVAVPESLAHVQDVPDIIHGHTQLETMAAALTFPGTPVVATCHGFVSWQNAAPPLFPRLRRYIAVDGACADRLRLECAIPDARISLELNFVDLRRFPLREPLPARPARAAVFANEQQHPHIDVIVAACRTRGIAVEFIGGRGHQTDDPGAALQPFDLVFAKGRSALEGMAVGLAVILAGPEGLGPMVTTDNFDMLRPLNFGLRNLRAPVDADAVYAALDAFDARDARLVSERLRREADLDTAVAQMVALYRAVIDEHSASRVDQEQELRVAGAYLEHVDQMYRDRIRAETAAAALDAKANVRAKLAKARESARRSRESELQMGQAVDVLKRAVAEMGHGAHDLRKALARTEAQVEALRSALDATRRGGWVGRLWRRAARR